jgi:S1-C subfamily serine protease
MLRALALATLLAALPTASAVQAQTVLSIKIVVSGADGQATPVPRYLLLVSENPPSAPPRRVMTALDGTATVRLRPGNYTIESDQPFVYQGKLYTWIQTLDILAGRDATLELTAANAEVESGDPAAGASPAESGGGAPRRSSAETESAMLQAKWQESVVSIWTPTAHGSGFSIANGLIATSQRVVAGTGSAAGATPIEVQLSPALKVAGAVVGSDAERGVALVLIDPQAAATVPPVPVGCGPAGEVPAGQSVITIGSTRRQQKRMTSGTLSGRAAHLVSSDLMIGPDSAGGPVFSMEGPLVGLTTLLQEEVDGDARVVPVADLCALLSSADAKLKASAPPSAAVLPVEPAQPLPVAAVRERAASAGAPYRMTSADFDVAFITPAMVHAVMNPSEAQRRRQSGGSVRGPGPAPLDPLENFSNWSGYVADVPPVLLVRVTPRLVEGFWTKVARGAASTQGVSLPPIKRFKSGFARLRALCGDTEVAPVHPFRLVQRVTEEDAIYEGLYAFAPGALAPSCGTVKLTFFSEKEPHKGDTKVVDAKVIQQIADEFAAYRVQ